MKFIRDIIGEKREKTLSEVGAVHVAPPAMGVGAIVEPNMSMPKWDEGQGLSATPDLENTPEVLNDTMVLTEAQRILAKTALGVAHQAEDVEHGLVAAEETPFAAESDIGLNIMSEDFEIEEDLECEVAAPEEDQGPAALRLPKYTQAYGIADPDQAERIDPEDDLLFGDAFDVEEDDMALDPEPAAEPMPAADNLVTSGIDVPAPSMGRGAGRGGRVKTRLLGFGVQNAGATDPIAAAQASKPMVAQFPVGWIVVAKGPGRGAAFTLFAGVTSIGRGEDQIVSLNFGDNSISRENHAAIAFDPEQGRFFIGHGGKANLVRLNDRPVLATEELENGATIRVGETTLRFVSLCGPGFSWEMD